MNTLSSKKIAGIAILTALVVVLQAVGGTVAIGAVQLNFTLIPIVLGAIVYGATAGAFLGLACGVVVLIQVIMGGNPFYIAIWSADPVVTIFTCLVKTTLAGLIAGWLYKSLERKNQTLATFVASGIVPIVNTGLFIIGCLLMTDSVYQLAGGQNVLMFILVGLVTFNFFIEFAINLVLSPALCRIIKAVSKN